MSIYATAVSFDSWEKPPFLYEGSHVSPTAEAERGGEFDVSVIPPHIGGEWADFLRFGLYGSQKHPGTVLLHRSHVEALHAFLGEWLRRELPMMQEEAGGG